MKQKVSDYIADFIARHGIREVFTVTGGGAMHLNDSFGHHPSLHCTYHHHEQAAAMAAEAYARVRAGSSGKGPAGEDMAAVCVTTGPGASNAVTGALGAWMGSVPMFVISGQARYDTTIGSSGLPLRSRGIQECDIVPIVKSITKYAVMVKDPAEIRLHLERALFEAENGRPGPVWLDVPLNVQGASVETEELAGWERTAESDCADPCPQPACGGVRRVSESVAEQILEKIRGASRPVLLPGFGVRNAGAVKELREFAELAGVPVLTGVTSVDLFPYDHPLFAGRSGMTGDRAGNFAVQNSDVLFAIGNRLGFQVTGFQTETWAREAYRIMCDADENELRKKELAIDLPVAGDAGELLSLLVKKLKERGCTKERTLSQSEDWRERCRAWRARYPAVLPRHYEANGEGRSNLYAFYDALSDVLPEGAVLCVSVGTSRAVGSQVFRNHADQRFVTNSNTAAMGFDLPAVIGASRAARDQRIVAVTGEGSFMMNLQELQTIRTNGIRTTIFLINNRGYQSIRQTQKNYFGGTPVGIGPDSGDLGFPDFSELAKVFGFRYLSCRDSGKLRDVLAEALREGNGSDNDGSANGCVLCEIFVTTEQPTEPKTSSKKLPDGSMVSAPLEDMAPFLPEAEVRENMLIPPVGGLEK